MSQGAGTSQELSPTKLAGVVAAAVQPCAAVTRGVLNNKELDMMLDSGSSMKKVLQQASLQRQTQHHHHLNWYLQQVKTSPH